MHRLIDKQIRSILSAMKIIQNIDMLSGPNLRRLLLTTIYLIPLVLVIWFIDKFGVNVPNGDQWELIPFFTKVQAGQVTFQDFFAQHNEHRILLPRIIITALAFASGWNTKLEMFVSVGFATVTFGLIYAIAYRTKSESRLFHLSTVLSCAFIFSLGQWENWLWGFQIAWFLINFCLVAAISCFVLLQKRSPTFRLLSAGLFCLIASFSLAHGLFSWLSLLPLIVVLPGTVRQRILWVGLWLTSFAIAIAIYKAGYFNPSHLDNIPAAKFEILLVSYPLTLLGSMFGGKLLPASMLGACLLINFLVFNFYFLKNMRSKIAQNMAPWISLGWFPILFTVVTSIGRSPFGSEQAMSSRYTTVTVLLLVSLTQLWRIIFNHSFSRNGRFSKAVFLSSSILAALLCATSENAIAIAHQSITPSGNICLELIYFLDTSKETSKPETGSAASCLSQLYPSASRVLNLAPSLEKLHFRHFPKPGNLKFVFQSPVPYGYVDSSSKSPILVQPQQRTVTIFGWTVYPDRHSIPEVVLLSYDDEQLFSGFGSTLLNRPDVAKALKSEKFLRSGWQTELNIQNLSLGEHKIKSWVYDRDKSSFFQLEGEVSIIRQ